MFVFCFFCFFCFFVFCVVSYARSHRNSSLFRCVWSDDRSRLLDGRATLFVYIHHTHRVLDRVNHHVDWPTFIQELEREEPIMAPSGHPALDVLGTSTSGELCIWWCIGSDYCSISWRCWTPYIGGADRAWKRRRCRSRWRFEVAEKLLKDE